MKPDKRYEVIHDEEAGLQIHDIESGMVADLAVLEHTWRKKGQAHVDPARSEPDVQGHLLPGSQVRSYGGLHIRLAGATPYAIKLKVAELRLPGT